MKTLKSLASFVVALLLFGLIPDTSLYAQKAPQLTDPEIASIAVTANQIDVDYAILAEKKSKNAEILRFAKTMKDDHNAVIKLATDLAHKLGVTPKMNATTQSLLDGAKKETALLHSKSHNAFNKAYIDNEVAYHKAVVGTVETVLIPQSKNAELKALLVKVLPTLKTHLEHAEMVQKNLK